MILTFTICSWCVQRRHKHEDLNQGCPCVIVTIITGLESTMNSELIEQYDMGKAVIRDSLNFWEAAHARPPALHGKLFQKCLLIINIFSCDSISSTLPWTFSLAKTNVPKLHPNFFGLMVKRTLFWCIDDKPIFWTRFERDKTWTIDMQMPEKWSLDH